MRVLCAVFLLVSPSLNAKHLWVPNRVAILKVLQEKKASFLGIEQTQERPRTCPLKSGSQLELANKLLTISTGLRNGACDQNHAGLVSNVSKMVGDLTRVRTGLLPNSGGFARSQPSGSTKGVTSDARSRTVINQFVDATKDQECLEELRSKGFLPIVADIVTNMGQMAMIVPSPGGVVVGAAGVGIGSTLKVLNALFSSPFHWERYRDRKQFLDLNCSFYDVRRSLHDNHFFDYVDDPFKQRYAVLKQRKTEMEKAAKDWEDKRVTFLKSLEDERLSYTKHEWGNDSVALYYLTRGFLEELELLASEVDESVQTWAVITGLARKAESLFSHLSKRQQTKPFYYYDNIKSLWTPFISKTFSGLSKGGKDIKDALVSPSIAFFRSLFNEMQAELNPIIARFDSSIASGGESFKDLEAKGHKAFGDIIELHLDILSKLNQRIDIYSAKIKEASLTQKDESSRVSYAILKEYKRSKDAIFGRVGWSFLSYMIDEVYTHQKRFRKSFKKWNRKFLQGGNVTPSEINWACRDASQLRILWETSTVSIGLSYDFFSTNQGLLSSKFPRFKKFAKLIPVRSSKRHRLYHNFRALEFAKAVIEGNTNVTEKDVIQERRKRVNLGWLALKQERTRSMRKEVETFYERNQCRKLM